MMSRFWAAHDVWEHLKSRKKREPTQWRPPYSGAQLIPVEGGRVEGGAEVEVGAGWESIIMEGESESESESEDSVEDRGLAFGSASRRSCSLRRRFPMTGEGGGERGMKMKQVNEKMWELG